MIDIFVDPTDWGGGFIVVTNVAHQLAREILYRSEDASGNNVTLNLGKPIFDLVKPTGVGRGIIDPNCGVSLQEIQRLSSSCARLNCRQLRGSQDLAVGYPRFCQKIDKLRAG